MRRRHWIRSKTQASSKGTEQSSPPVFERLESRIMLSADLPSAVPFDPFHSDPGEQVICVDLRPGSTGVLQSQDIQDNPLQTVAPNEVIAQAEYMTSSALSVINTDDAGEGSLRWAIDYANAHPEQQYTISFAIGDGPQTIRLSSVLAVTTGALTIDGTSQPGIELDATSLGTSTVLTIAADGCVVQGLAITNAQGTAVQLLNANGCTLSDLDLSWSGPSRSGMGVYINHSSGNTFEDVIMTNRAYGLDLCWHADSNAIRRCDGSNAGIGVTIGYDLFWGALGASDGNTVEASTFTGSGEGIVLAAGADTLIRGNGVSGCVKGVEVSCFGGTATRTKILGNDLRNSVDCALIIREDSQFEIKDNDLRGSVNGLYLVNVDGVSLSPANVDLREISRIALNLENVTNSTVEDLDLSWSGPSRSGMGVYINHSSGNTFEDVIMTNRAYGLDLCWHADSNAIRRCDGSNAGIGVTIGYDLFWGALGASDGNTVEASTFTGSGEGIVLAAGADTLIRGNGVSGCVKGVEVSCFGGTATRTKILGNDLRNSVDCALIIREDSQFEIKDNDLRGSVNGLYLVNVDGVSLSPANVDLREISRIALNLENVTNSTVEDLDLSWSGPSRSGMGVYINHSSGNTFEDVIMTNRAYGLDLCWHADSNAIRRCDGSNAGIGVTIGYDLFWGALGASDGNTVEASTFTGSGEGIVLAAGADTLIRGNGVSGCVKGVEVSCFGGTATRTKILGNDLRNSVDCALIIREDSQFEIKDNDLRGSVNGLYLVNVDGVSLSPANVDLREISRIALNLENVTNSTVEDLDLSWSGPSRSGMGVYINHSSGNTFEDVIMTNRAYGLDLCWHADSNAIRRCDGSNAGIGVTIGYDLFWGALGASDGNTVEASTFTGSGEGIVLAAGADTLIRGNGVSGCVKGVEVSCFGGTATRTKILGNDLRNSVDCALIIREDSQFEIKDNDLRGSVNGLYLVNVDGVSLSPANVDLREISRIALNLENVTNSTVEDLDLSWSGPSRSGMGVYINHSSGNTFEDVIMTNRAYGLDLCWHADSNAIRRCDGSNAGIGVTIGYDLFWGALGASDGNTVEASTFTGSGEGIVLAAGADTLIRGNGVSGCVKGVEVSCFGGTATRTKILGNSIHSNSGAGVGIAAGTGNLVQGNSIYSNGGLGIDLGANGVTLNDAGDTDTGPNNYQNFPMVTALRGGTRTHVMGTLNSSANTTFTLDFYANTSPDPSGYGQGERYLGSATVTTDSLGNATFDARLPGLTALGEFITATATDPDGNTSEFSAVAEILSVAPTVAADVQTQTTQYSDPIQSVAIAATAVVPDRMNASTSYSTDGGHTFTPGLPDAMTIAGGIGLTGGTDQVGTGTWTLSGVADLAPGTYVIRVTITDEDGGSAAVNTTLVVSSEDAAVTYSGPLAVSTTSANDTSAVVELRAVVQDMTAVNPTSDPQAGNITKATVTFVNRVTGEVIARDVPVGPMTGGDGLRGMAKYDWAVDLGTNASASFTIGMIVKGYYTRNDGADDAVISVSKVTEKIAVHGNGWLVNSSSAGLYAGDPGLKTDFKFSVKFDKKTASLQGDVEITIRQTGRVYQIKGESVRSLTASADGDTATVIFRASLVDITDSKHPVTLASDLSLAMTLTSLKKPVGRSIGITLWGGSQLLFSSRWLGTRTTEQVVDGGNIAIQ